MKKKNLAALLMAGAMCFGLLAGCSGSGDQPSTAPSDAGTQDTQPAGNTDGVQGGGTDVVTIKVGGIGPITGDLAQYGTATQWGAILINYAQNCIQGKGSKF